jgi:branched-chain amino acid transport system permease protein
MLLSVYGHYGSFPGARVAYGIRKAGKRPRRDTPRHGATTLNCGRSGAWPGLAEPALELFLTSLLNGLSYGLLLFMLTAGLTLVFSLMGVLNFAHASLYMLGAYYAWQLSAWLGFWPALLLAPLAVGLTGALVERWVLRRVHARGQVAELIATFGVAWLIGEAVHLVWGRSALDFRLPPALDGTAFTLAGVPLSAARCFIMGVALAMLGALWLVMARTRLGLLVRAALDSPRVLAGLGHDVQKLHAGVFAAGAALAGLAGAIGGAALVTEPGMAETVGSIIFVIVVVGGLGSLLGAFVASLFIGLVQTFAVAVDVPLGRMLAAAGMALPPGALAEQFGRITVSQAAPALPYLLMLVVLLARPRGLMGSRAD